MLAALAATLFHQSGRNCLFSNLNLKTNIIISKNYVYYLALAVANFSYINLILSYIFKSAV